MDERDEPVGLRLERGKVVLLADEPVNLGQQMGRVEHAVVGELAEDVRPLAVVDHGVEPGRNAEELPDAPEHGVHELDRDAHLHAPALGGRGGGLGFDAKVGGALAAVEFAQDQQVGVGKAAGHFGAQLLLVGRPEHQDGE